MVTKNRIGNALAVAAAVLGLVLVFSGAGHGGDARATPPPADHVVAPPAPGQVRAPAPAQQTQGPATPPGKDDDGDG